jgi:hypothetical protein
VHDVEQVVTTPFSHLMRASTHCLRSFYRTEKASSLICLWLRQCHNSRFPD